MKRPKARTKRAIRQNITVPAELYEESMSLARQFQFQGISELVHHFMRLMLANGSPHFFVQTPQPPSTATHLKMEAFKKLQASLQLTPEKAAAWMAAVKDARR